MEARCIVVGAAWATLSSLASTAVAQDGAPPEDPGCRLRVVRANDGTAIACAEVFDFAIGEKTGGITARLRDDPDHEIPKVARRLVADRDGYVTLSSERWHTLLARAPGRYRLREFIDPARECDGKLELLSDEPLTIELVDSRGAPVEGAIVTHGEMRICGSETRRNDPWRATSDGNGRVFFAHYASWLAGSRYSLGDWVELQTPVNDPPQFGFRFRGDSRSPAQLDASPQVVRWQLPPLAKIRVEFTGADAVPPDRAITFEMVGPHQYFGVPDRYASDQGKPVELLTETGVALRACFHWREPDSKRYGEPDLRVFGSAHPIEGGCALLRVPLASDPVTVRVRPMHGDGAAFTSSSKFDVSFQWFDRAGFRFKTYVGRVAPDETGTLRLPWLRPRIEPGERPAKLRVALRAELHLYGWEPLEPDDLVSREVDWPAADSLDVGTLVVPGAK